MGSSFTSRRLPRRRWMAVAVLAAVVVGLAAFMPRWRQWRAPRAVSADVTEYLSAQTGAQGFARVTEPRPLRFPEDVGSHPDYQTEWWYYTGNLAARSTDGPPRRFGFQLTFFRRALTAESQARASAWGTNQLYLAHFTVTDGAAQTFHSAERLARGAAGLAGAHGEPYRVWLETWSAGAITATNQVRLVAADGPVAIDLALTPAKPPARHGRDGFSPKGPEPGNASFYYSTPRLAVDGEVATAAGRFNVSGTAWMDHEWSTSALGSDEVGWDWFSLQLDDGRELMVFQIRQADGGVAIESSGSLIGATSEVTTLAGNDFAIRVLGHWTSPRTGAVYPSGWRVVVPHAGLDVTIAPLVRDQELDASFKYWEGAVTVTGTAYGQPTTGRGYVELTGYAPTGSGVGLPGTG